MRLMAKQADKRPVSVGSMPGSSTDGVKKARVGDAAPSIMELAENSEKVTVGDLVKVADDLHEDDRSWTKDLGWVPKADLMAARDREIEKLVEFGTFKEVDSRMAAGAEVISVRFVEKYEEDGGLRSRCVTRGYEAKGGGLDRAVRPYAVDVGCADGDAPHYLH